MGFDSLYFLLVLPFIILIFYVLPKKIRPYFLLVVSYLIYGSFNWWVLLLLFFTSLLSYLFAIFIEITDKNYVKKLCLVLSILIIFGALFIFKYLDFAYSLGVSIFNLFGANVSYSSLNIILPVGISFYTFQTMAYVFDVYKGKLKAERNPFIYCLFVSFFPQLVAGPIEKAEDLLPQLKNSSDFKLENIQLAIPDLLMGYLKKIAIADFFGVFVAQVAANMGDNSGLSILLSLFAFSFQIYGDFAGYSQIAAGLGKALGVDLTKNFDKPYLSSSIHIFWRRWHITLNRFFNEYIYIPLGGNRKGKFRKCLNIMIIFLLSGLWHGASLKFLIWGGLHGVLMIIEEFLPSTKGNKIVEIIKTIGVFLIVSFLWVFFYPETLQDSFTAIKILFSGWGSYANLTFFNELNIVISIIAVILIFALDSFPKFGFIYKDGEKKDVNVPKSLGVIVSYAIIICVIGFMWSYVSSLGGGGSFIYFQF